MRRHPRDSSPSSGSLLLPPPAPLSATGGVLPWGGRVPAEAAIAAARLTVKAIEEFRSTETDVEAREVALSALCRGYVGDSKWPPGSESAGRKAELAHQKLVVMMQRPLLMHTLDFLSSTPGMGLRREPPPGGTPTPSSIFWKYAKTLGRLDRRLKSEQLRQAGEWHRQRRLRS